MINTIRLYWTNYTNQDGPPTLSRTLHTTTSLFAVGYSTSYTQDGRFLLYHSAYFTVPGTREAASLDGYKVGGAHIQFQRRESSASSSHRIYWCWTQSQWIPLLSTTGGEDVTGKFGATINENPCCFSAITNLDRPAICH
jgi:hypothetical protein